MRRLVTALVVPGFLLVAAGEGAAKGPLKVIVNSAVSATKAAPKCTYSAGKAGVQSCEDWTPGQKLELEALRGIVAAKKQIQHGKNLVNGGESKVNAGERRKSISGPLADGWKGMISTGKGMIQSGNVEIKKGTQALGSAEAKLKEALKLQAAEKSSSIKGKVNL